LRTVTCTATYASIADNHTEVKMGLVGIVIDMTPPLITATLSPPANINGWNNTDVTVRFEALDRPNTLINASTFPEGEVYYPPPVTLTSEGPGQTASASATDRHANTGHLTVNNIHIDKTPPTITPSIAGSLTPDGRYLGPVTVSFSGADALSGLASVTLPITLTNDGANQSVTGTATDLAGNTASVVVNGIHIVSSPTDTTPPTLTLNGANPLLLELGTPYTEPGATATDLVDGDLSPRIQTSGGVDSDSEGSYTITYTVSDAVGNTASASRTVQVAVTPNSYGLIATHSLHLRQSAQITSGFVGVVNQGQKPFLAGKVELVVGTRVQTAQGVRLSAPRVRVRQHADLDGELIFSDLVSVGKHAAIAQQTQVPSSYFPLFQDTGLPAFLTGTPGAQDVEVRQKKPATLSAGAYDEVSVKQKGTLTFTGGTYHLADLAVGPNAEVRFLAPTVLLIRGQLALDQGSTFGPGAGSGISASDIRVYVEGRNGRLGNTYDDDEGDDEEDDAEGRKLRQTPRAAKIGVRVNFQGNLYAPNGTLHLRQGAVCVGSFIGKDVIVGVRTQVATQSGWNTPGVVYQPQAPAPLTKLARAEAALPNGAGLLTNYPNPFNPSTTIAYQLPQALPVRLTIYNLMGQPVRVLADEMQEAGPHALAWDGRDQQGQSLAAGVYLCRLQAGELVAVQKLLFAK